MSVLEQILSPRQVHTAFVAARYTVRSFSIRRNEEIAAHVTIRGAKVPYEKLDPHLDTHT